MKTRKFLSMLAMSAIFISSAYSLTAYAADDTTVAEVSINKGEATAYISWTDASSAVSDAALNATIDITLYQDIDLGTATLYTSDKYKSYTRTVTVNAAEGKNVKITHSGASEYIVHMNSLNTYDANHFSIGTTGGKITIEDNGTKEGCFKITKTGSTLTIGTNVEISGSYKAFCDTWGGTLTVEDGAVIKNADVNFFVFHNTDAGVTTLKLKGSPAIEPKINARNDTNHTFMDLAEYTGEQLAVTSVCDHTASGAKCIAYSAGNAVARVSDTSKNKLVWNVEGSPYILSAKNGELVLAEALKATEVEVNVSDADINKDARGWYVTNAALSGNYKWVNLTFRQIQRAM